MYVRTGIMKKLSFLGKTIIKASFHLLDVIKQFFSQEAYSHVGAIRWVVTSLTIQCRKKSFSLICRVLTSIILQTLKPAIFRCLVEVGTIFVINWSQFIIIYIELPLGSFLNVFRAEHQKMQRHDFGPYLLTLGRCTELRGFK